MSGQSEAYGRFDPQFAFDLVELDGDDLRKETLDRRRALLRKALVAGIAGIQFSEHFEGDGAALFAQACKFGVEGIVSKRRDIPYVSSRSAN